MSEPDAPLSGATASTASSGQATTERLFAGRYRLSGRRGSGLDIALFEGVDMLSDRTVAIKIVHPDICTRPGFEALFTDVIHRVAVLRHPNIAQILDAGEASWSGQSVQYVVCENLTGGSLRDLRDRGRQLSPSQVVMVGLDVCRGLDVAHRAGLVHGDIRPANLVFGDDGGLRITDLGLADLVADEIWANPAAVSTDRARYASPEQATGVHAGPKSDIYSLCLCLLEAVTGQLPFIGDSTVATLSNRVDRLMPVSADLGPLAAVFERGGRPDPRDRFTAAEFGRALVQAAERLPRPAPIALLSTSLFGEAPTAGSTPDATAPTTVLRRPATPAVENVLSTTDPTRTLPTLPIIPPVPVGRDASGPSSVPPEAGQAVAPSAGQPSGGETTATVAAAAEPSTVSIPPPPQPDPPLLRESTARRKLLAMLAIIVVAATLGGALAWFLGRDQTNEVPDLAGIEQGAALNMIAEFDWNVTTELEPSDDIEAGLVVRTNPTVGAKLGEGADFVMFVSSGPAPRTLPELNGLTVEQAEAALTQLGLVLELGGEQNDDVVPVGQIVSWSVPEQAGLVAGDTVTLNTTVRVILSSGPAPRVVPELTGRALSDAIAEIEGLSLVVAQLPDEFNDTVPIGAVIGQDPPAGTPVEIGATVTIVVSKGTEFVTIPPLANLTLEQANAALTAAGLVLGEVKGDPSGVNILAEVDGVSIAANAVFPRGTPIDLTFGEPPPPPTEAPTTIAADTSVPPA